ALTPDPRRIRGKKALRLHSRRELSAPPDTEVPPATRPRPQNPHRPRPTKQRPSYPQFPPWEAFERRPHNPHDRPGRAGVRNPSPKATFNVGPMNGREASESGLR